MPALAERWDFAETITHDIQYMMLNILAATRMQRERMVDGARISSTHRRSMLIAQPLHVPNGADSFKVRRNAQLPLAAQRAKWQHHLTTFLCKWSWVEQQPQDAHQGMTWLELAVAYEIDMQQELPAQHSLLTGPEKGLAQRPSVAHKSEQTDGGCREVGP